MPLRFTVLGDMMAEMEGSRASLESKVLMAKWILSGTAYRKGEEPFQDFKILMDLRNALAHVRYVDKFEWNVTPGQFAGPDVTPELRRSGDPPKVIQGLRSKEVLAIYPPSSVSSWIGEITTAAVAFWACNAASDIVHSLLASLPEGSPSEKLRIMYKNMFDPIAEATPPPATDLTP